MERLDKLVNILKLTPHRQPELVKEAAHRILNSNVRSHPEIGYILKPLLEILIQYCDSDDSVQRSLFNDYLNYVILAFQYQHYRLILNVFVDELVNNSSARRITVVLLRIPQLIRNVQPIELDCDTLRLLKALIEIARRSNDESVQKALDGTLKSVMPFLDYHVRSSKEAQFLSNSLVEVLLRNLHDDSSQIKRIAASSIASICSTNDLQMRNTIIKLKNQLDGLKRNDSNESTDKNKLVGLCLCARELNEFTNRYHAEIIPVLFEQIASDRTDQPGLIAAFETLREVLSRFRIDQETIRQNAKIITEKYLIHELPDGTMSIREDSKVILQTNAIACLSIMIKQQPSILDSMDCILHLFKSQQDVATRNQTILLIGNYIDAYWRFPDCLSTSVDCGRIRKLWVELRSIINDDFAHPDTLKTCITSIRACVNTILESDHCLNIVEYEDIDRLIHVYTNSNFKPLKIEALNLFTTLNYRTLHYLERQHWSKLRCQAAGSLLENLQDRIINEVIIASLTDEHQRIRTAASAALIKLIPNLFTPGSDGLKISSQKSNDPIVALASSLASEHMVFLDQRISDAKLFSGNGGSLMNSEARDRLIMRDEDKLLTSSIIFPHRNCDENSTNRHSSQFKEDVSINLSKIVSMLKVALENSLAKGKNTITSLVRTLYDLSLAYPIHEYSSSWDCRQSEYCDSFILLNFLMTYLENLVEPDVIIDDLEAYRYFLLFINQLLYALCHESVQNEYETQRARPYHTRVANVREGDWSELTIKYPGISDALQTYLAHLVKLLWLIFYVIEEKTNPFAQTNKFASSQKNRLSSPEASTNSHETLTSNALLFGRVHKKLESSFRSSKKNLNQEDEKFYQLLDTCLLNIASLLEFSGMARSMEYVKDILSYLKVTSEINCVSSLICARQLLKSLFGINIIAMYQVDPHDWFEEDSVPSKGHNQVSSSDSLNSKDDHVSLRGVYYHLISNPYRIFSNYQSKSSLQITPGSDKAVSMLNAKSRRTLQVRRRIEDRVRALFEPDPHRMVAPKIAQISAELKNIIAEFTPIVTSCMEQFSSRGFCQFQAEILHFMCYLLSLRVNYPKLPLAMPMINAIYKLLDDIGDRKYVTRKNDIELFLRSSFIFLTLLTYERSASKPLVQVATIIQKFDDLRAKLSIAFATERDVFSYTVPLLRCLIEDLFICRIESFQNAVTLRRVDMELMEAGAFEARERLAESSNRVTPDHLEAERETVAQKLLDISNNADVYDLISILILESRRDAGDIKYRNLSKQLLSMITDLLSKRAVNLSNHRSIDSTRRIIENISPEVFHPINFIIETLLASKPPEFSAQDSNSDFQRWMSLVLLTIHIFTQVKEEEFLFRINEFMSDQAFVGYLLHIAQLCVSELTLRMYPPAHPQVTSFLVQQLSCYMIYITNIFQSGVFQRLASSAAELIKKEVKSNKKTPLDLNDLCLWARNPCNGFSLDACESMFYFIRLTFPDLTISWCNVMNLLDNVDCNQDFWRNLLVYECQHCSKSQARLSTALQDLKINNKDAEIADESLSMSSNKVGLKRSGHVNRPSSLNLSDVRFSDQVLRRSFIKKIAANESTDKTLNRNIVETSDEYGQLLEHEVNIGNTEQCLAPNVELSRRGVLCLVLDYVSISMNDVEHITWLIIHHINDIIRWSFETPIAEFINAVHRNSASSGIFIQAINSNFSNLMSISFVTRLLWSLEKVHYTQYGSLVVLLVEKLLSSTQLMPYRSLIRKIEEFASETVRKLLNETNKSLITTNDEVINQLTGEDLDGIISLLDPDLYPDLRSLLMQLRSSSCGKLGTPTVEVHKIVDRTDSDDDDDVEGLITEDYDIEALYKLASVISWLSNLGYSGQTSRLIPALDNINQLLTKSGVIEKLNADKTLVCFLISSIYSLSLTHLAPPTRLYKPKFWSCDQNELRQRDNCKTKTDICEFRFGDSSNDKRPKPQDMPIGSRRPKVTPQAFDKSRPSCPSKISKTKEDIINDVRNACLEGSFLFDNVDLLQKSQFECISEIIIRLARLPLVNSFILAPPSLWRDNIWPTSFPETDEFKMDLPMVTHDILLRDNALLDKFCDRILKLGWINRRQFEEVWMTLLGVLSATLSRKNDGDTPIGIEPGFTGSGAADMNKMNVEASCKVITTLTKYLDLSRRSISGDPLSPELFQTQSFDDQVFELTRKIGTNLPVLSKKMANLFESIELDQSQYRGQNNQSRSSSSGPPNYSTGIGTKDRCSLNQINGCKAHTLNNFSHFLRVPAQKLRLNSILNVEVDLQETVVIESPPSSSTLSTQIAASVDVESCIRLVLSIYKQKLKDPNQDLFSTTATVASTDTFSIAYSESDSKQPMTGASDGAIRSKSRISNKNQLPKQLPPPLTTAIVQSMLTLSDMFSDYEQFMWLFETFANLLKVAERNNDAIQTQYLVIGLCKIATVCCYETPNVLNSSAAGPNIVGGTSSTQGAHQREAMFELCRLSVDRCLHSEFVPLKICALSGIFYMLEDSINIVASGAWELDDFKRLRQMRLAWIMRLMPIVLDKEQRKHLTSSARTIKLLETLCETITETELKAMKNL